MTTKTGAPTQTPKTREEFEAILRDKDQLNALLADDKFGDFVQDYAKAWNAHNVDTAEMIEREVQKGLAAFLKDNGGTMKRPDQRSADVSRYQGHKGEIYNQKAPGAAIDRSDHAPDGPAEFLQAVWHLRDSLSNGDELGAHAAEWRKIANSFGSTVPADGGFLIPETLRSELLKVALEESIVRQRATVIPMSSLSVPIPAVDSTSNASSVFGGVVGYWTEEAANATESQAKFGRVKLEAKKLVIRCDAPNELVADAPAFGGFLDQVLPTSIAWFEDIAFFGGGGVGEPLGFLNSAAAVNPDRGTNNEIHFADVVAMYSRMLPSSLGRAVWIASQETLPQLLTMTLATGNATIPVVSPPLMLTNEQGIQAPTMTILGRPLIISEKASQLGSAGDLSFVDLSYYLVGDRQVAQASSSPHYKFVSDETVYKITERVDGRPWLNSAITPQNGGDTLSPFVILPA